MKITIKIWFLIICVVLSLISIFSIPPLILQKGVKVSYVSQNTSIFDLGLRSGMIIREINGQEIKTQEDFLKAIEQINSLDENETEKVIIKTDSIEIVGLFDREFTKSFGVEPLPKTRIKTGLDLKGGARAFVRPDKKVSESELMDLISVTEQRLNVYGLSDVKLFLVKTASGENLMGIEIAGSTPKELEELIAKQGVFEAKIANNTIFVGGKNDIVHVGRTGQEAYISDCGMLEDGEEYCNFRFSILLSQDAAERMAETTKNLSIQGEYLNEKLDLYLDEKLVSSLSISSGLKGKAETQIMISGSGKGKTRQEAIDSAKQEMKKLQTVLITGSLPYKLEIVKLDKVSPKLGEQFVKRIMIGAIFAIIGVSLVVFVRYRNIKASLALISVSFSEVIIILGIASLISWNLDLPSIAGIIAAIGTGVDSQLIILDESRDKHESMIQRIKKALFIIFSAFMTTFVAMIPLTGLLGFMGIGATSAGLFKGFAVTTIIGISAGVLISRPAFGDIARQINKD